LLNIIREYTLFAAFSVILKELHTAGSGPLQQSLPGLAACFFNLLQLFQNVVTVLHVDALMDWHSLSAIYGSWLVRTELVCPDWMEFML